MQIKKVSIVDSDRKKNQINSKQIIQILQPIIIVDFSTHSYISLYEYNTYTYIPIQAYHNGIYLRIMPKKRIFIVFVLSLVVEYLIL